MKSDFWDLRHLIREMLRQKDKKTYNEYTKRQKDKKTKRKFT